MARKPKKPLKVETLVHEEAKRSNIPTAELQSVLKEEEESPYAVPYGRRNRDLDPQLLWRGKDEQDWSDLVVQAPPLYIQEKVHPKVLIDDLMRETKARAEQKPPEMPDLFADFNGLSEGAARTEFYQHDQNWSNRMILGDSLQVMASLAEREGLRGKVQCIYIDPPYGIKFNSNFQWSTTSRDVRDGKKDHISREPEQVKAFRDTWREGIHSYLSYLRDRLTVARDLLSESGSLFVQIGDENVHLVRTVVDEILGDKNFLALIPFVKTTGQTDNYLSSVVDYILWYARDITKMKYRQLYKRKILGGEGALAYTKARDLLGQLVNPRDTFDSSSARIYTTSDLTSQSPGTRYEIIFAGSTFFPKGYWKTEESSFPRLIRADRIEKVGRSLRYVRFLDDYAVFPINNSWPDTGVAGFAADKVYVVQTTPKVVERCLLMATDPGDLVLDPTCGSGTTAHVAEQWGRRWITIDTSRVALALARSRIMGARYPYYFLADSPEGQQKEAEVSRKPVSEAPIHGDIRQGFVYERVPHITLKSVANNAEIDVIWERFQEELEPLRDELNAALGECWEEWQIPLEADEAWPDAACAMHARWWEGRIARQKEIDASIAAKADYEYLYDKPYVDTSKVRVAGPFTVESLSPHRVLAVDEDDELIDLMEQEGGYAGKEEPDFAQVMVEHLKISGVQQAHKEDRIAFTSIAGWPGDYICAEGRFLEGEAERRAGILIGPEFGTVSRPDLVAAAREAGDAGFDLLVACAFNYDARTVDFSKLGRIPILKARMNPDLHMAGELKNTGQGNLFVVFGEPDIEIEEVETPEGAPRIRVHIKGVDVFHPQTGEITSSGPEDIAIWFIDTDYNEEAFFVRHAYFLGAGDPFKALKTTLKAEIDEEAWSSLNSDVSRPFEKPQSGRIAVKVINHLGDEVMKVFGVD